MSAKGFIHLQGRALEYVWYGPGSDDAPTLVMLHEGLGCAALWRDVPELLAEATGWGVCAYSRAGYGASDPKPLPWALDYMTREAVDVLPEVLDQIGFRKGAILGHSDGATITAIHAGRVRDPRVAGICLIAPHFFTEPGGLSAIAKAKEAYDSGDLRDRLAKYHSHVDCAFRGWNDSWLAAGFKTWNVQEVLDEISVPVLAVQGDRDPYGTMAQIDVISQRCSADVSRLVLEGGGHAPHIEAKETVLQEITAFLKTLECAS